MVPLSLRSVVIMAPKRSDDPPPGRTSEYGMSAVCVCVAVVVLTEAHSHLKAPK